MPKEMYTGLYGRAWTISNSSTDTAQQSYSYLL